MKFAHRRAYLAGLIILAAGCGGPRVSGADASDEQASVRGKVTVKGKPPSRATIEFNGSNIARKNAGTSAPIGKDGTYTIKAFIGENQAMVVAPGVDYNQTSVIVKPGENTLDIVIP